MKPRDVRAGVKLRERRVGDVVIEERRLSRGRSGIRYEVAGEGKPLVLVHGLSGSSAWWRHNVPALAGSHLVLAVDLMRFGGSRGENPFVLADAASLLIEWFDELGLDRVDLAGHSMGGFIASDLAASHPERVRSLVLVCAAAIPFDYGYLRHALGFVRALRYLRVSFLSVLAQDALSMGPLTLWRASQELLHTDIREKLARIEAPSLVIWGRNDTVVPLFIGERLAQEIPGARLVVIDRAGHNPMWDEPQAFNSEILAFLAERDAARGHGGATTRRRRTK